MKNTISLIAFAFVLMLNFNLTNAQTTTTAQPNAAKFLKPKVFVTDLVFAYQLLNSIELRGSEVDALIEIKNVLKPFIEKIQKESIPLTNLVTFDIQANIAANLLQFMERGKFTGADVERYKRFVDGIVESAKEPEIKLDK
jgi:hypothetical protein